MALTPQRQLRNRTPSFARRSPAGRAQRREYLLIRSCLYNFPLTLSPDPIPLRDTVLAGLAGDADGEPAAAVGCREGFWQGGLLGPGFDLIARVE